MIIRAKMSNLVKKEIRILKYLHRAGSTSLGAISTYLPMSRTTANDRLLNLMNIGIVERELSAKKLKYGRKRYIWRIKKEYSHVTDADTIISIYLNLRVIYKQKKSGENQ